MIKTWKALNAVRKRLEEQALGRVAKAIQARNEILEVIANLDRERAELAELRRGTVSELDMEVNSGNLNGIKLRAAVPYLARLRKVDQLLLIKRLKAEMALMTALQNLKKAQLEYRQALARRFRTDEAVDLLMKEQRARTERLEEDAMDEVALTRKQALRTINAT